MNLATFTLVKTLRSQIHENLDQLTNFEDLSISSNLSGITKFSETSSNDDEKGKFSRSEIRKLAKEDEGGLTTEQAKHIAILQKAESDLLIVRYSVP